MKKSTSALSGDMKRLSDRFPEFNTQSEKFESRLSEMETSVSKVSASLGQASEQAQVQFEEKFKELEELYADRFKSSLEAFNEDNRIKAPVELWEIKQKEHETRQTQAFGRFVWSLGLICLVVAAIVLTLIFASDHLVSVLSPAGCDPAANPELCKGFSFRGMILSGAVLTLLTLGLWFARIQMKEYLSERHLVLDARERRAFAQTYIGMLDHGDTVNDEAKEQRALVYAALFRPGSDGIIKDEGGIDPSLTAALSKLLTRS